MRVRRGGSAVALARLRIYAGSNRGDHFFLGAEALVVAHGFFVAGSRSHGVVPGIMLRIEGFASLPDGEDQVQQFAHAVSQSDVATHAPGTQPPIEGPDGGVMPDGRLGGVP